MYKFNICGDISWEKVSELSDHVDNAVENDWSEVQILLASDGGDANAAFAMYDILTSCKLDIKIHCTGNIASAAILVLAAGDYRVAHPNTRFMVHEDELTLEGSVTLVETKIKEFRYLENKWCELLTKHTKLSAAKWKTLHQKTTYFGVSEAEEYGLIDRVISTNIEKAVL